MQVLKNQAFIRWTTANKSSAALIITPAQCSYSSASRTGLSFLLILSDSDSFNSFWLPGRKTPSWEQHFGRERLEALQHISERSSEAHKAAEKKMMQLEEEMVQWGIKADICRTAWEECGECHCVQRTTLFSIFLAILSRLQLPSIH